MWDRVNGLMLSLLVILGSDNSEYLQLLKDDDEIRDKRSVFFKFIRILMPRLEFGIHWTRLMPLSMT